MDGGLSTFSVLCTTALWGVTRLPDLKIEKTQSLLRFIFFRHTVRVWLEHGHSTCAFAFRLQDTVLFKFLLFSFFRWLRWLCYERLVTFDRSGFDMCWVFASFAFLLVQHTKFFFAIVLCSSVLDLYFVLKSPWRCSWTCHILWTFKVHTFVFRMLVIFLVLLEWWSVANKVL